MDDVVVDTLLGSLPAEPTFIEDLWVFRSVVVVRSRRHGVSGVFNPRPTFLNPASRYDGYGALIGRDVREILPALLREGGPLDVALGLAALDSALPLPPNLIAANAIDLVPRDLLGARICCVGRFPLVEALRAEGRRIEVVEKEPVRDEVPWEHAADALARAELLFITGKTLVNGTLREVIQRSPNVRFRVLMGPSAMLCPALLGLGLDVIGSTLLDDVEGALRWWRHGGYGLRHAPQGALLSACISRHPPR
jgi:uncharacterized protein (DUF4213/DUF364 family)